MAFNMRRLRAFIRLWRADQGAVAAVEFAMILPVLVLLMVGTLEIARVVMAERRVSQIASLISDVVGREDSITADDLNSIYSGAAQFLAGYDTGSLKISLIPVKASPTDATKIRVYAATNNRRATRVERFRRSVRAIRLRPACLQLAASP